MREGTPQIASFKRTLATLEALITGDGSRSIADMSRDLGMPAATIYRQIATLIEEGYLMRLGNGRYVAGARLRGLLQHVDEKLVITSAAAPMLHRLAGKLRSIAQLGTFENDMVTYRVKTGQGSSTLFTKVGMQLEAYCSAIGKILLAHLPEQERAAYLSTGPFVPLTDKTIVDPAILRDELETVRERGFALDQGEVAEGLSCIAVPLRTGDGRVIAAISVTQTDQAAERRGQAAVLAMLRDTAQDIERLVILPG